MRGSSVSRKMTGDRGSSWIVSRRTSIFLVLPWGVSKVVCAHLHRLATIKMKSLGMPRKRKVRPRCKWSTDAKAWVKSRYAIRMSLLCVGASSMQRLGRVMALEQDLHGRKPSYSELMICFAPMLSNARTARHDAHSLYNTLAKVMGL